MVLFTGCGKNDDTEVNNNLINNISYGEKYFHTSNIADHDLEDKSSYYVINENGTGEYHLYQTYDYSDVITDYIIKFTYKIVDEHTIVCIFDLVEYIQEIENPSNKNKYWVRKLTTSKDVVIETKYLNDNEYESYYIIKE